MKKLILLLVASLLFLGCSSHPNSSTSKKTLVLVTVQPYVTLVRQIAGDSVDVIAVIPPSADPHTWEPTINQISKLHNASYWFTIGEIMEAPLIRKLKESNPELKQVVLYTGIERLPEPSAHCAHCFDTHMWLSPKALAIQAKYIYKTLADNDPSKEPLFRKNFKALNNTLHNLDKSCQTALKPYAGKILVTSHGAYTYFCHDYGLRQMVIEPSSGKEPRAKDMTELIDKIRIEKPNIVGIFFQPQHANKAAAIIAKKLEIPSFTVDPLASDCMKTIESLKEIISQSNS